MGGSRLKLAKFSEPVNDSRGFEVTRGGVVCCGPSSLTTTCTFSFLSSVSPPGRGGAGSGVGGGVCGVGRVNYATEEVINETSAAAPAAPVLTQWK